MPRPREDLTGIRFTRLTVIKDTGRRDNSRSAIWLCLCDCGAVAQCSAPNLKRGNSRSCGCLQREYATSGKARLIHGLTGSTISICYTNMIRRCYEVNNPSYVDYGGRGIKVCDRWLYGENGVHPLTCFSKDMGERPQGKTLGRIDNDADYEPGNCRWETYSQQNKNRRPFGTGRRSLARE